MVLQPTQDNLPLCNLLDTQRTLGWTAGHIATIEKKWSCNLIVTIQMIMAPYALVPVLCFGVAKSCPICTSWKEHPPKWR